MVEGAAAPSGRGCENLLPLDLLSTRNDALGSVNKTLLYFFLKCVGKGAEVADFPKGHASRTSQSSVSVLGQLALLKGTVTCEQE